MLKDLWLIWCRTVDHRIGKTDDDEPNIPILTIRQAQYSLIIRSFIIVINLIQAPSGGPTVQRTRTIPIDPVPIDP